MKIFFDTEFTGLHKGTTIISIGLVSNDGKTFYAEFNDYDRSQLDDWLKENVIANLKFNDIPWGVGSCIPKIPVTVAQKFEMKGSKKEVAEALKLWLSQWDKVEMWSDCPSYDWVLFCDLYDHAFNIPANVYYILFDICTLFYEKDVDPDINREVFVEWKDQVAKHNALHDALIIRECFRKLKYGM